ncbi:hypothetical protein V3C33_01910 [Micrococcaceae bacterium Sec5.7]
MPAFPRKLQLARAGSGDAAGILACRCQLYVTTPGSPVSTKASFQINDGVPGLQARA